MHVRTSLYREGFSSWLAGHVFRRNSRMGRCEVGDGPGRFLLQTLMFIR